MRPALAGRGAWGVAVATQTGGVMNMYPDLPSDAPELPPGGVWLTADEAVHAMVIGDHPESIPGNRGMITDMIATAMLMVGQIAAARLPDGRLAFTPTRKMVEMSKSAAADEVTAWILSQE